MTVEQIIEAVRFCIDEESLNAAEFLDASAYDIGDATTDNGLMNNIIRSKIGDAVRWVCLYGPAELLSGSDETRDGQLVDTGILVDVDGINPTPIATTGGGYINLPTDFIKLARVRCWSWHRAVINPISEDSEEYLQLYDPNGAEAAADRPQAVIINRNKRQLEVWPTGLATYTYVADVGDNSFTTGTGDDEQVHYPLPPKVKTAFIYYLAYLLLSAYNDARSARMLEIAKMNIGRNG